MVPFATRIGKAEIDELDIILQSINTDPETAVISIDFDDVVTTCCWSDGTVAGSQFSNVGLEISGLDDSDPPYILHEDGGFGVSGHSSPNFLAFGDATGDGANFSFGGLDAGIESFSIGVACADGCDFNATAYKDGHVEVAHQHIAGDADLSYLNLSDLGGATYVVVEGANTSYFVMDDLQYGYATSLSDS